jgi:DNA-binding beta-propeller fold protein YncE
MVRMTSALALVVLALAVPIGLAAKTGAFPLRLVARVALPGASNRFDYTSVDATTGRLYIAHMNSSVLLVLDLKTRHVIDTIAAPGVHGVIAVPQLGRVFASATDDHEVLTIDARTEKVIAHAAAGSYPDGLAYDPVERHVFISDESGGVETVINARGAKVATVALGGEAGNVQYDAGSGHMLVDVHAVVRRIHVDCAHPHGLLVDSARRLAFVACDGDAMLLTLDLRSMTITGSASVGPSPDVLAFDAGLKRLYVAAESGQVAVFAERGHSVQKLGQTALAPAAHTVAVDPRTHLVYFPLERGTHGTPQLLVMKPR